MALYDVVIYETYYVAKVIEADSLYEAEEIADNMCESGEISFDDFIFYERDFQSEKIRWEILKKLGGNNEAVTLANNL